MYVKDVAKAFGLKVKEFSSISGYTRQGLYGIIEKNEKASSTRFEAFLNNLQLYSDAIYSQDVAQAKIEKNERERMIEKLRKLKEVSK